MRILDVVPTNSLLLHNWQQLISYHNLANLEQQLYAKLYSTLTTHTVDSLTTDYLIHFNQFVKDRLLQVTNELLALTSSFEQLHAAHLSEISQAHLFKLLHDELPLTLHLEFADIKKYMLLNLECYFLALFGAACIVNVEETIRKCWRRESPIYFHKFELEELGLIYKQIAPLYSCKQAMLTLKARRNHRAYSLGQFMHDTNDELNLALGTILYSPKPLAQSVSVSPTPTITPFSSMILNARQASMLLKDQRVNSEKPLMRKKSVVLPPIN